MRFDVASRRRRPREAVVPMINVVFLLLIFFLMTASIAPPSPFDLSLPEAGGGEEAAGGDALYMDARGTLAFGGLRGDAALRAAANLAGTGALEIRADRDARASDVAGVLSRLHALGVADTRLVTERP